MYYEWQLCIITQKPDKMDELLGMWSGRQRLEYFFYLKYNITLYNRI